MIDTTWVMVISFVNWKELELVWCYSTNPKSDEIDVIIPYNDDVENVNNSISDDAEFVNHFGLDYDQVNCIELI